MFGRRSTNRPAIAAKDAWFRSSDWDERARADFETRLARARPNNRVQYRRIKAIALLESGDRRKEAAGRGLLEQILADPDAIAFEKTSALSMLGAHEQDAGHLEDAERHFRAALGRIALSPSGSNDLEEVRLAEILLARGAQHQLEEARRLLDGRATSPPLFLSSRFRMCLAGARVCLALNDDQGAAVWAATALDLAALTHSGLANHPGLGLVETDSTTRAWLSAVAARRT